MSKWTIGRTLARSNYFKSVPQKVPLMTAEHMRKREAWCIAHQIYNFDNVILRTKIDFSSTDVLGKDGQNLDIVKKWCQNSHQLLLCGVE